MTTFLTQHDIDKKQFVDLISKVSSSIAKTFIDDKAYGGPTPDELKRIIKKIPLFSSSRFKKCFELYKLKKAIRNR